MALDPAEFNPERFRPDPLLPESVDLYTRAQLRDMAARTSQAFKQVIRHINRLDQSLIPVGEGGYLTRPFPKIPVVEKDGRPLVRTFTDEQMIEGEGDWELAVGTEIP